MSPKVKRKRLVQGRDFHGWVWEAIGREWSISGTEDCLFHWAEPSCPTNNRPTEKGRWVRVRFVKVGAR